MQSRRRQTADESGRAAEQSIYSRFDEIYASTNKAVLAYITAKCGRTADISDIFQDAYLELFQALRKRGAAYVTNEKAFVLRIAKQKLSRYYSLAERLKMFVSMTVPNGDGEEVDISGFDAQAFLTEEFAVNSVILESARRFISQKPENVKKVFYLFYDVGLTIKDISKAL
jgi:DNA-directed RNA polymerase specialized sigma24 family protein